MVLDDAPTLEQLLAEQRRLTPVERFAQWHDRAGAKPHTAGPSYRDLIPLTQPQLGEQYAFDVDLASCSGCKACVSACHSLNGLKWGETWRTVGLLIGQGDAPALQHVTTACHHCLDPACMVGCPTNAYEKDPVTGIVRHLDDQCFGCQYCTMTCPYGAPQYSSSLGIVRKCDMCHGRLAAGEAPACVQACPNQAIRISIVRTDEVRVQSIGASVAPGAVASDYTHPTTTYRNANENLSSSRPADAATPAVQHAHFPLVVLLVCSQAAVGGMTLSAVGAIGSGSANLSLKILSLLLALTGLGAATLHLGRPQFAFRGMLGWRHSWMSREAIAFGAMAPLAAVSATLATLRWLELDSRWQLSPAIEQTAAALASVAGLVGVHCSIRIYQVTRRPFWTGPRTSVKFWGTTAGFGMLLAGACTATTSSFDGSGEASRFGTMCCLAAAIVLALKFAYERRLTSGRDGGDSSLRGTTTLLRGDLRWLDRTAIYLGVGGSVAMPAVLAATAALQGAGSTTVFVVAATALVAALAAALVERTIYFQAVTPWKMPGGAAE